MQLLRLNRRWMAGCRIALLMSLIAVFARPGATRAQDSYQAIIDASKAETGTLLIYSDLHNKTLAPLIAAFNKKYAWIKVENAETTDVEVFENYFDDVDNEAEPPDILISSDEMGWADFVEEDEALRYTSIEDKHLPDFARDEKGGIYLFAANPTLLIWNRSAVKTPVTTLKALGDLVAADPTGWANQVSVYDASRSSTAFDLYWHYVKAKGDAAWPLFEKIGQAGVRAELSSEKIVADVVEGRAKVGMFVEAGALAGLLDSKNENATLGWSPILDGMPIAEYWTGIAHGSARPNQAKLWLDFVLSAEGQTAIAQGGLPAYREDLAGKVSFHDDIFFSAIDESEHLFQDVENAPTTDEEELTFIDRWQAAFKQMH